MSLPAFRRTRPITVTVEARFENETNPARRDRLAILSAILNSADEASHAANPDGSDELAMVEAMEDYMEQFESRIKARAINALR